MRLGRVIVATTNEGKRRELASLLGDLANWLPLPAEVTMPEETGLTFLDNALSKARHVAAQTGMPVLADDSGLTVDALSGEPGVRSARFAGQGATDEDNRRLLLSRMKNVPDGARNARFVAVLALVWPDGREMTAEGACAGTILREPRGTGGFGYDSLFFYPPLGRSFAELEPGEKNAVSHRAYALSALRERLVAGV
jgi:XTP/dITP diphosphohydrolase